MKTLKNVGEIRQVYRVSDPEESVKNIAKYIKGYDFQYAYESLKQVQKFLNGKQELRDTDWQLLYDERDSENAMSLVRESKYEPKIYAFVFENQSKTEIGLTYMEPKLVWLEQAKDSYGEDEEEDDIKQFKQRQDSRRSTKEKRDSNEKVYEKNKKNTKKEDNKSETNEISKSQQDRIESNISKDDLKVILSARLANVLKASEFNKDFSAITTGYPELQNILKEIYDPESLKDKKDQLPYKLTESEVDQICRHSRYLKSEDVSEFKIPNKDVEPILED